MASKKKSRPGKRGRKPNPASKSGKIRDLLKTGMKPADIAKKVGCTPALVYNVKARESGGGKTRKASKRSAAPTNLSGIDDVLAAVRTSQQESLRMRRALEKIQAVLAEALD